MSENVKNLSEFDFQKLLKEESKPILVDFYAKWCSPCKMQAPILDELAKEISDKAVICKIDVDECEELAVKYGVSSIPTIMVFKEGEIKEKSVGLASKSDLASMLIKHV
ncbi:MAG: thioredoxin [Clostridia bacterium]|nr:thioredoxin [Clostridia bacterium]